MKKLNFLLIILIFTLLSVKVKSQCQAEFLIAPDSIQMGHTGPYAFFDYSYNTDSSQINTTSWYWTVSGNGVSSTSSLQNPVFYFNNLGVYNICLTIITSDSCMNTFCDSLLITQSSNTSNLSATVTGNDASNFCDGYLVVNATGGTPPYQYVWSTGSTSQYIDSLCAGYYEVTIYDAMQNSVVTGGYVNQDTSSNCYAYFYSQINNQNQLTTYDFTDYSSYGTTSWSWTFGDGTSSNEQNPIHIFPSIGNYTVCLTIATINGCTSTYCETIYIDSCNMIINGTVTNTTSQNTNDGAIDITVYGGIAPYSYIWFAEDSTTYYTQNISNVSYGSYYVEVTDANGCISYQQFYIAIGNDSTSCGLIAYYNVTPISYIGATNGSIDVTVVAETNPVSYLWNTGTTTQDLINIGSGTYSVTIADSSPNCPSIILYANIYEPYDTAGGIIIDSLFTSIVDTCFNAIVDSFYVSNVILSSNSSIAVNWVFVTNSGSYTITTTYTCSSNGNYIIYLTLNCGTFKTLTTYMTYINVSTLTSNIINDINNTISLYPNPVVDKLNIELSNINKSYNVEIYNIAGKLIFNSVNENNSDKFEINTSEFAKGVYILKVITENNQLIGKFIK